MGRDEKDFSYILPERVLVTDFPEQRAQYALPRKYENLSACQAEMRLTEGKRCAKSGESRRKMLEKILTKR